MGALGSKEDLGQITTIYGYHANDFPWYDTDNRSVYRTTGLIVNYQSNNYVVTTRSKLISCKNIIMYHKCFTNTDSILRNDLHIIFQSIEYNILILATKNCDKLDFTTSDIISGFYDSKIVCPSYVIPKEAFVVPTKRSQYYTVIIDMNLESENINYKVHIHNIKFKKSIIYDKSYLPENYMYHFQIPNKEYNLLGIYGAAIYNKKYQLVGLVTLTEGSKLYVLPTKTLSRVFYDFIDYINKPSEYLGFQNVPFSYDVHNNDILNVNIHNTKCNDLFGITKTDNKLISINNYPIIIKDDKAVIYDNDFADIIPLELFFKLNITNTLIDLCFINDARIINKTINTVIHSKMLLLTDQPYFYPQVMIPYVKIKDIIIVKLTHELLDIAFINKIRLKNELINSMLKNTCDIIQTLIVIDCLDIRLADKYDLPQLSKAKKNVNCPLITLVNNKKITTLSDLNNISTDNIRTIHLGLTYSNQYKIKLA